jgi:hypothetical protein
MTTWIKASDRLPRYGVPVVVEVECGSVMLAVLVINDCEQQAYNEWCGVKLWWTGTEWGYNPWSSNEKVIRWHPLPRPPRVRKSKEIKP